MFCRHLEAYTRPIRPPMLYIASISSINIRALLYQWVNLNSNMKLPVFSTEPSPCLTKEQGAKPQ